MPVIYLNTNTYKLTNIKPVNLTLLHNKTNYQIPSLWPIFNSTNLSYIKTIGIYTNDKNEVIIEAVIMGCFKEFINIPTISHLYKTQIDQITNNIKLNYMKNLTLSTKLIIIFTVIFLILICI